MKSTIKNLVESSNLPVYLLLIFSAVWLVNSVLTSWLHPRGPEVVVYLDKDAKQPALLPLPSSTNALVGERAILWWTVYNKGLNEGSVYYARETADLAVQCVYGKAK